MCEIFIFIFIFCVFGSNQCFKAKRPERYCVSVCVCVCERVYMSLTEIDSLSLSGVFLWRGLTAAVYFSVTSGAGIAVGFVDFDGFL